MFMTPAISGSNRVNNDTFGLMPLNVLNGSDSAFLMHNDPSCGSVPPSYEEAVSNVLRGSLAFDTQRDSRNPSPSTPRSRKGDNSPRPFKMSPTPSRVAPVESEEEILTLSHGSENVINVRHTVCSVHEDKHQNRSPHLHRSSSDPPPAYDDVVHMPRDANSCPVIDGNQTTETSLDSGNISIISPSGVNGIVLSEIEQSAHTKSRKRKRMRHVMCACVIVLLVIAIPVVIVLMTSGSFETRDISGQITTTKPTTDASTQQRIE